MRRWGGRGRELNTKIKYVKPHFTKIPDLYYQPHYQLVNLRLAAHLFVMRVCLVSFCPTSAHDHPSETNIKYIKYCRMMDLSISQALFTDLKLNLFSHVSTCLCVGCRNLTWPQETNRDSSVGLQATHVTGCVWTGGEINSEPLKKSHKKLHLIFFFTGINQCFSYHWMLWQLSPDTDPIRWFCGEILNKYIMSVVKTSSYFDRNTL